MLKNLMTTCFKGSIRQNELVELALTHQFDSIDIDMGDMFDRAAMMGKKFACQFFSRARIKVGTSTLPISVGEAGVGIDALVAKATQIGDLAKEVGCSRARLQIGRSGPTAYHENFETHRKQIAALADALAPYEVSLGLMLSPAKTAIGEGEFQFIQRPDELLTLAKMIARPNVGIVVDGGTWQATEGAAAILAKVPAEQIVDVLLADRTGAKGPTLPSSDETSFAVTALKYLGSKGYEGTIAITGSPEDFGGSNANEVAQQLNRLFDELYSKAGVATEPV